MKFEINKEQTKTENRILKVIININVVSNECVVQGAADLEGDVKRKYFGYCFIIFINLQYRSQIFSHRFENRQGGDPHC